MNPAQDALYRIHQFQAHRRSQSALPMTSSARGCRLPPTPIWLAAAADRRAHWNAGRARTRLSLGRLYITPNAAVSASDEVLKAVARHAAGDWGTMDEHDWQENDRALRTGGRLFSAYQSSAGQKFWVITECDRRTTTLLLPDDY